MGGKFSRDKGARNERLLRDHFRSLGFKSDRVPLSGAANCIKGDVILEKSGQVLKAELKVRQNEFKSIYAFYENCHNYCVGFSDNDTTCIISLTFDDMGFSVDSDLSYVVRNPLPRTKKKIMGLQKMLFDKKGNQVSDFLVIRIHHKPFLFLRFLRFGGGPVDRKN